MLINICRLLEWNDFFIDICTICVCLVRLRECISLRNGELTTRRRSYWELRCSLKDISMWIFSYGINGERFLWRCFSLSSVNQDSRTSSFTHICFPPCANNSDARAALICSSGSQVSLQTLGFCNGIRFERKKYF